MISKSQWWPDQVRYYELISAAIPKKKIVFAEGATGLGKTIVQAELGHDLITQGKGPVVMATLTLETLAALASAWYGQGFATDIPTTVLFGRNQLVNPEAAQAVFAELAESSDPDEKERAENALVWLRNGGKPIDSSRTAGIVGIVPWVAWLVDDLVFVCPGISLDGCLLSDIKEPEKDNPAMKIYSRLRAGIASAQMIICTQAMLAFDVMLRCRTCSEEDALDEKSKDGKSKPRGKLGPYVELLGDYHSVILDEAHDYERIVSSVNTKGISLLRLRHFLKTTEMGEERERRKGVEYCDETHRLYRLFLGLWGREEGLFCSYGQEFSSVMTRSQCDAFYAFSRMIGKISEILDDILSRRGARKKKHFREMDEARESLRYFLQRKASFRVAGSPVYHWPSISVGKKSVYPQLRFLWKRVQHAILSSATLLLPQRGEQSAHYMAEMLGIHSDEYIELLPVIPRWVTSPVTLMVPDTQSAILLSPPTSFRQDTSSPEWMDAKCQWRANIAWAIDMIAQQAPAGTLVLATSYNDIEEVADQLRLFYDQTGARLICRNHSVSFGVEKAQYEDMVAAGMRPIWLSLGSAWTGMDTVIGDLALIKVPFNCNQTMTFAYRARLNPNVSRSEAAYLFRQGIGRLVRGADAGARRLWILDGKVWGGLPYYSVFRQILERYRVREEFSLLHEGLEGVRGKIV